METVTIIRCKDCKHCHVYKNGCNSDCDLHYGMTNPNGFCSDAEPKSSD